MAKKLVFWNRESGKSKEPIDLERFFPEPACRIVSVIREVDLRQEVEKEMRRGCETVVAAGGDGTVNAVVNAIMHVDENSRPKLGILPLGTANDFAGTLAIPDDVEQAIGLLDSANHLSVDVVQIKAENFERYYANVAAGGNSVRVSEEMTDELKLRWGVFCYLRGAIGVVNDLETYRVTAQCDGQRFENIDTWAVLVANGKTNAGRLMVAPKASPVDGLLDVILVRDGTMLDLVEIVSRVALGSFLESDQVIYRQVKELDLKSTPGMRFTLDGEVIDQEPVHFTAIPQAIRMFVGEAFFTPPSE